MPTVVDNIRLTEKQDRRVKLLKKDKEKIRELYATGEYSQRQLAKMYNVSRKTILLTVNDEAREKDRQYAKDNWKRFKKPKEQRVENTKKTRDYKRSLYYTGKLDKNYKYFEQNNKE